MSITKILILAVLGLMIFGPEQLPRMAAQAGKALRDLRRMAENAKSDLTDGLGPDFKDFDFNDLNPKSFVRKHLMDGFDDDDDLSWSGPSGGAVTDIDSPDLGRTELGTDGARTAVLRDAGVHDAPQFDVDAT
ncbi:MAG TPA: sec-independent translocase [Streptosporangiaceae bacterium]